MIFITDDDVVLETVPRNDCEGCYFDKGYTDCDSPLTECIRFTTSFIWKPISNKTKNKLMSLLTNKRY